MRTSRCGQSSEERESAPGERAVHKSVHHGSYGARGSHESGHDHEGRVARACHAQPGRVRGHDSEVCPMKTLLPRAERAGHVTGREGGS